MDVSHDLDVADRTHPFLLDSYDDCPRLLQHLGVEYTVPSDLKFVDDSLKGMISTERDLRAQINPLVQKNPDYKWITDTLAARINASREFRRKLNSIRKIYKNVSLEPMQELKWEIQRIKDVDLQYRLLEFLNGRAALPREYVFSATIYKAISTEMAHRESEHSAFRNENLRMGHMKYHVSNSRHDCNCQIGRVEGCVKSRT